MLPENSSFCIKITWLDFRKQSVSEQTFVVAAALNISVLLRKAEYCWKKMYSVGDPVLCTCEHLFLIPRATLSSPGHESQLHSNWSEEFNNVHIEHPSDVSDNEKGSVCTMCCSQNGRKEGRELHYLPHTALCSGIALIWLSHFRFGKNCWIIQIHWPQSI